MTGYSGLIRYKGTQHREPGLKFSMRAVIKIGLVILAASHAAKSYIRCKEWQDEYTLYKSGLKVCPQNAKVGLGVFRGMGCRWERYRINLSRLSLKVVVRSAGGR